MQLSFQKVQTVGTSNLTPGRIYFETSTHMIHVATGEDTTEKFGIGVKTADWDESKNNLVITNQNNDKITIDFSDLASARNVSEALADKIGVGSVGNTSSDKTYYGILKKIEESIAAAEVTIGAEGDDYIDASAEGDTVSVSAKMQDVATATSSTKGLADAYKVKEYVDTQTAGAKAEIEKITLEYAKNDKKIYLKGATGETVSEVDTTDFVKDGMLSTAELKNEDNKTYIVLTFNTDAGSDPIKVDVSKLIDVYTAGLGIEVQDNVVSAKVLATDKYLKVDETGLHTEGIDNAISTAIAAIPDVTGADVELTGYTKGSSTDAVAATDTVNEAIAKLENRIVAAAAGGVTSFGGTTGDITVDTTGAGNGTVVFSMDDEELKGSVKGLKSAAYTDASDYAVAANGISTVTGDANITATKTGNAISVTATLGTFGESGTAGLATVAAVKSYVEEQLEWVDWN